MKCKQLFALLLVSALALTSIPISEVEAAEVTETGTSSTDSSFSSADLFDGELIVMIPDEVNLTLNDEGTAFEGTGFVTAWGVAASSTVLNVTTETNITYEHALSSSITANASVGFGTDGTASWDGTTLRSNVDATQKAGYDVTATVNLEDVPDIGTYNSVIPFNIELVTADSVTYYMGYKYVTVQSYTTDDGSIEYEYLPSGDTVAELQAFSTNREDLENAGYDYVVASTSTSLEIPEQINGVDVVGVSLNSFFANDEISGYVTSVTLPASVEGIELTDNTASASETVITSYNYRTAVKLSKSIPTNAVIRFIFQDTEMFLYYADTYNGVEGYACCGLSTYGISVLENANTDTVTLEIPDTYNGKPVITLDYTSQGGVVNEGMSFVDTFEEDVYSDIALVCGDNILFVEGAWNSSMAEKSFAPKITSIAFNEGLLEIYTDAFGGCSNLQSINIPASVTTIGRKAFFGCTSLESLVFNEGFNGTIGDTSTSTFAGAVFKEVTLPSSMTTVDLRCFNYTDLSVVNIENNVADVTFTAGSTSSSTSGDGIAPVLRFNDATYLARTSDDYVFTGTVDENYNLVFASDEVIGALGSSVKQYLGHYSYNIDAQLIVSEGVTTLPVEFVKVLSGYPSPVVQLPSTLTTIGQSALYNAIIVGNTDFRNATIGSYALQVITDNLMIKSSQLGYLGSITDLYIEYNAAPSNSISGTFENVETIYFSGTDEEWTAVTAKCSKFESTFQGTVYTNASMNITDSSVLDSASGVYYEVVNDTVTIVGVLDGVTNLTIPSTLGGYNVTTIADSAFTRNTDLVSVSIPSTVTSIGNFAFNKCTALTTVTNASSSLSFGNKAFYNCTELESFDMPATVVSVENYAFYGAPISNVTTLNVTGDVGDYAFQSNSSITTVTVGGNVGTFAFNNAKITSATLEGNVLAYAFQGCNKMTSLTLSENAYLGNYAFQGCNTLTSVTIPSGVTFGAYVFYSCSGLETVVFEDGVETIGENAFYSCSNITSVTIPTSVTTIGSSAFKSCSNLAVTYQGTMEQWSAVSGITTSNFATGVVVTCTDGSVTIE